MLLGRVWSAGEGRLGFPKDFLESWGCPGSSPRVLWVLPALPWPGQE